MCIAKSQKLNFLKHKILRFYTIFKNPAVRCDRYHFLDQNHVTGRVDHFLTVLKSDEKTQNVCYFCHFCDFHFFSLFVIFGHFQNLLLGLLKMRSENLPFSKVKIGGPRSKKRLGAFLFSYVPENFGQNRSKSEFYRDFGVFLHDVGVQNWGHFGS